MLAGYSKSSAWGSFRDCCVALGTESRVPGSQACTQLFEPSYHPLTFRKRLKAEGYVQCEYAVEEDLALRGCGEDNQSPGSVPASAPPEGYGHFTCCQELGFFVLRVISSIVLRLGAGPFLRGEAVRVSVCPGTCES